MGFTDALSWIGQLNALFGLITSAIVCVILWIAGIYIIISKREYGKGLLLIILGALILGISAIWYYIVMRSKTMAMISGVVGIADVLDGGKSTKTNKINR